MGKHRFIRPDLLELASAYAEVSVLVTTCSRGDVDSHGHRLEDFEVSMQRSFYPAAAAR